MKVHFYHPFIVNQINESNFNPENGLDHWITTTFLKLKKQSNNFTIGSYLPEQGIIVFHKRFFPKNLKPTNEQFFICLQVDSGRYRFAHWHIVHNPFQAKPYYFPKILIDTMFGFSKTKFIFGWPQNNMIKRSVLRGSAFKSISYHGNISNIPEEILSSDFKLFLENNNLKLILKCDSNLWNDFHDTDITLCLRDFTKKRYYSKPFLKITNSLIAGVPVISGFDSSSKYFKNMYVDIPLVKNMCELKNIILEIKANNYLLANQIEDFKQYDNYFQDEFIEEQWVLFFEQAMIDYKKWLTIGNIKRKIFMAFRNSS